MFNFINFIPFGPFPQRRHAGMIHTIHEYVSLVRDSKKRKDPVEPKSTATMPTKQLRIDAAMSSSGQPTKSLQVKQHDIDKAVMKFIVEGIHPLSTVEEPAFVSLMSGT